MSVQVDDVCASVDFAGICLGSCWQSWSVSLSKKVFTGGGYENVAWVAWGGVGRAETGF
jgi:hypothetical protein